MKIFGYREGRGLYDEYGVTCGVVIAQSIEDAKKILKIFDDDDWDGCELFEIPFERGYTFIGEYSE